MSMKYLLDGKIMLFYTLFCATNISLINNLMLLNYFKRYMLLNEHHLSLYTDSQTIKRRVGNMFINYCKEKVQLSSYVVI